MKRESRQSLSILLPAGAEGSAGLPNLPNLPFSEFGSYSNTNPESSKSTVFRIGTNQTHLNIATLKVPVYTKKRNCYFQVNYRATFIFIHFSFHFIYFILKYLYRYKFHLHVFQTDLFKIRKKS